MESIFKLGRTSREAWSRRAALSATKPFLHFKERSWTYGAADEEIRRLAGGLANLGVRQGDRVAVGMTNRPEALFVHFAIRHLGAIMVGLVPGGMFDELAYQLKDSDSAYLIADNPIASLIAPRASEFPSLRKLVILDVSSALPAGAVDFASIRAAELIGEVALDDYNDLSPAEVLYTSGSTSKPKGVLCPAGALVSGGGAYADRFGFTANDHFVLPFTLQHGTGAWIAPGMVIHAGGQLTLLEKLSPSKFWSQVEACQGTMALLFPAQINLVMKAADAPAKGESSLRHVITHEWIEELWDRFGIPMSMTWGSTETGAMGAGSGPDYRGEHGMGYLGRPFVETEIATFDANGRRLQSGDIGELRVKHPHCMICYLNRPELSAETVVDGWVCTGDLGLVEADGTVRYTGRLKNMIKRAGENISPPEVELIIHEHGSISECMVFGVPDALRKEEVALVACLREDSSCSPEELFAFAASRMARTKLPRFIRVMHGELPRLAVGKLDRNSVVQAFEINDFWDARALMSDPAVTTASSKNQSRI
jgi:acyl-CoA synthetase (AMP-forming)/AMP-acid ligase II